MGEGHQQAVLCVRKLVDLFLTGLLLGTEEQHIGGTARKGETKDGLDSISGGSVWKHLEGEEQTLMSSDKATQRGLFSSGSRHLPLKLQL